MSRKWKKHCQPCVRGNDERTPHGRERIDMEKILFLILLAAFFSKKSRSSGNVKPRGKPGRIVSVPKVRNRYMPLKKDKARYHS